MPETPMPNDRDMIEIIILRGDRTYDQFCIRRDSEKNPDKMEILLTLFFDKDAPWTAIAEYDRPEPSK